MPKKQSSNSIFNDADLALKKDTRNRFHRDIEKLTHVTKATKLRDKKPTNVKHHKDHSSETDEYVKPIVKIKQTRKAHTSDKEAKPIRFKRPIEVPIIVKPKRFRKRPAKFFDIDLIYQIQPRTFYNETIRKYKIKLLNKVSLKDRNILETIFK